MDQHKKNRRNDGVWQGPIKLKTWEHIKKKWLEFNVEPRHLRLGLAMDGVNPYSHFSS